MKPPIFVWEPNDMMAFESVRAVEGWVEWQDVDEGTVFDSEGRLLELYLVQDPRNEANENRRFAWFRIKHPPAVRVRSLEDEPGHKEELRSALLEAFSATGDAKAADARLEELSSAAAEKFLVR